MKKKIIFIYPQPNASFMCPLDTSRVLLGCILHERVENFKGCKLFCPFKVNSLSFYLQIQSIFKTEVLWKLKIL